MVKHKDNCANIDNKGNNYPNVNRYKKKEFSERYTHNEIK